MSRTVAFFDSTESGTGDELFETDGTAAGTVLVQDIDPGPGGSDPADITATGDGGVVFIASNGGTYDPELYVTNGTASGTVLLNGGFIEISVAGHQITYESSLADFTPLGDGKVLFEGATQANSIALWITDGTFAGTMPLMEFALPYTAPALSNIMALGNGTAVFDVGATSATQHGLWATNGTSAGTLQLSSVAATPEAVLDGEAITTASDGAGGILLGMTDGTVAGTTTIHDFAGSVGVGTFTQVGGRLLFIASDGLAQLWATDGTAAGTVQLVQEEVKLLAPLSSGKALFTAPDGGSGTELWVTDGTAAGTMPIFDIDPGASNTYVGSFRPFGAGKALFEVGNILGGPETLWVTDGTAAGTMVLQTITGTPGNLPYVYTAALPDGKVLFDAPDGGTGTDFWVSDGTVAGTSLIADLPQTPSFLPPQFTVLPNGRALFDLTSMNESETGWSTDGTAAGTVQIADFAVAAGAITAVASPLPDVIGSLSAAGAEALDATLAVLSPSGTTPNAVTVPGATPGTPVSGVLNAFVVSGAAAGTNLSIPAGFSEGYLLGAATGLDDDNGGSLLVAIGANDTLQGAAADTLIGGNGNDTLIAGGGAETLFGGTGANFFDLAAGTAVANTLGTDTIFGGAASDTINAGGAPLFFGASGATLFNTLGATATLVGGGAETVSAGGANVLLFSGAGGVDFTAGTGASTVVGGAGGNTLTGGAGGTLFFGDGGNVYGAGTAVDTVVGFTGSLTGIGGANGTLFFTGTAGGSDVGTGAGSSTIIGFGAHDSLSATGAGADVIEAAAASETINATASSGTNIFFAFGQNDVVQAGTGATAVQSFMGSQTLAAGTGADLFAVVASGQRAVTFANFTPGLDFVRLQGYAAGTGAAALSSATVSSSGEVLTLPDGTTLTFQGLTGLGPGSFV